MPKQVTACAAKPSDALADDHLRLRLQAQTEAGLDGIHHMLGDSPQLAAAGLAVVDQDQGVAG